MTLQELKERQGWTLKQKVDHSLGAIDQFLSRTNGKAYVSFSGGKDSTVLLHLCRIIKPDIKAVFCNTGNEYPDIVKFVRATDNVEIIYPKVKPAEIFDKYGFPLISKEVSERIYDYKRNPNSKRGMQALRKIEETGNYRHWIPDKYVRFAHKNYMISHKCCNELKKKPFRSYERKNKVYPILGVMADESNMRTSAYVHRGGCNSFTGKIDSLPLSIWKEQDIWDYIADRKLQIADIYHKGAKRTGCMFCGYGCQFKGDNRLKMVLDMYPKMYDKFMRYENNGVTYREALRDVLAVNGLYLPDEEPANLFTGFEDML